MRSVYVLRKIYCNAVTLELTLAYVGLVGIVLNSMYNSMFAIKLTLWWPPFLEFFFLVCANGMVKKGFV